MKAFSASTFILFIFFVSSDNKPFLDHLSKTTTILSLPFSQEHKERRELIIRKKQVEEDDETEDYSLW